MRARRFLEQLYCAVLVAILLSVSHIGNAQGDNDWYRPKPPFDPDTDTPLILLPVTIYRPVSTVPLAKSEMATLMLANVEIVTLTADEWRELQIPLSPSELLERLIDRKEHDGEGQETSMEFPGRGLVTIRRASPYFHSRETAEYWRKMREQLRPYLIRAVTAPGDNSEFSASVWRNALTIIQNAVAEDFAFDPRHSHGVTSAGGKGLRLAKSPVIVYLEGQPKAIYTDVSILKVLR